MKNQTYFWSLMTLLSGFLIAGLVILLLDRDDSQPIKIIPAPTPQPMKVYLTGDVQNPGVYKLPKNSRLEDLFVAAKVEIFPMEKFNLSAKLYDGQHIHIDNTISTKNQNVIIIDSAKININEASVDQLMELPGIGETKANEIVQYRVTNGYFDRIEDILNVPGIGESTFNQFKDLIETNSID